jgi:NDP-sugar pyrophosphorylase family protein
MGSLTEVIPKPLIEVCGKLILDHIVEAFPAEIDKLILVVGYRKEQIKEYCGETFHGRSIVYVEQENHAGGTGDALMYAKEVVQGKFLFMYADDIHGKEALVEVVTHDHAMLAVHSQTSELFGVISQNDDGTLKEIVEKPKNPKSDLVNIGGFVVNDSIFTHDVPVSDSGELYATDMLNAYAQHNSVQVVLQDSWLPIGCPEHIQEAEAALCPKRFDSESQI